MISTCGLGGDVTFAVESGTYNETWNFSNFGNFAGNYHLTVTSAANDADSVILKPASAQSGVILNNTKNLTISYMSILYRYCTRVCISIYSPPLGEFPLIS